MLDSKGPPFDNIGAVKVTFVIVLSSSGRKLPPPVASFPVAFDGGPGRSFLPQSGLWGTSGFGWFGTAALLNWQIMPLSIGLVGS